MTSLYQRATPAQAMLLRMVEGAIRNAGHAHPEQAPGDKFARSAAKRAAGTISAQWPELLAACRPSDSADGDNSGLTPPSIAQLGKRSKRGAAQVASRTPSRTKWIKNRIGAMAGQARKAGNAERADALADALRVIAEG